MRSKLWRNGLTRRENNRGAVVETQKRYGLLLTCVESIYFKKHVQLHLFRAVPLWLDLDCRALDLYSIRRGFDTPQW